MAKTEEGGLVETFAENDDGHDVDAENDDDENTFYSLTKLFLLALF